MLLLLIPTFAIMAASVSAIIPQPHHMKRYDNDTVAISSLTISKTTSVIVGNVAIAAVGDSNSSPATSVSATVVVPIQQDSNPTSLRTITLRTTVTQTPPSTRTTPYPSSVLFNPQVAVVAAAPVAAQTSPVVTLKTVYLPTTIYVTNPCAAVQQSTTAQNLPVEAQITTITQTTQVPSGTSIPNVQNAAVDAVQVSVVPGTTIIPTSTQEATSYSTVRVTQTLLSTVTVHASALIAMQLAFPSVVSSSLAPYQNTTMRR